jgi:hypothetical protein
VGLGEGEGMRGTDCSHCSHCGRLFGGWRLELVYNGFMEDY